MKNPTTDDQGLIVAEKEIILKFTVIEGLTVLLACYYVFYVKYPNSCAAAGLLLFIQEVLSQQEEKNCKKTSKYNAFN